jgi:hypothetical protein
MLFDRLLCDDRGPPPAAQHRCELAHCACADDDVVRSGAEVDGDAYHRTTAV